jgi:tetratricopeptide (TPR) repeat protein
LTPDELDRFIQAGWWVIGPYPENLQFFCPPEKDPDPSRPVAAVESAKSLRWRPASTKLNGHVDLRTIFDADHISAYALTYVYAPEERTATLQVGGDNLVRVWLNGRLVHETTQSAIWAWGLDRVPVTLKAGRNTLLCKISRGNGYHRLYLRIADNLFDRASLHAQLGLWEEAAAEGARGLDRQPSADAYPYRLWSQAQLHIGDTAAYRRYLDRMFERYDKKFEYDAFEIVHSGVLQDGTARATRLVELAERVHQHDRRSWYCLGAGLAHYRAGQFDTAIARLEESLKDPEWSRNAGHTSELGIALAHHRLGHAQQARQWLDKAEAWYDDALQNALASPDGIADFGAWMDWPVFVVLRREAHKLILQKDLPDDPRMKKLVERTRDWLQKRDKATADYDVAILLSGWHPRLRLARGWRLAKLNRAREAEADFTKAVELSPQDPEVWKERGRIYFELGQTDKAAADFAKALQLLP